MRFAVAIIATAVFQSLKDVFIELPICQELMNITKSLGTKLLLDS